MAKASFELIADLRSDQGKGASRRLRRDGKVPAVLYGGHDDPRSLQLDHDVLVHQLDNEAFYSTILTIKVGDIEQQAILKDLQRHPAKRRILHADFQRIVAGEKITLSVPLHFNGEDEAPGVKQGGIVSHMLTEIEINCLPRDLPEYLEVDVSGMEIDDMLHLSDIVAPADVEIVEISAGRDNDAPVVAIHRPMKEEEPEEVEVGEVEGEGEAAAPEATADDDKKDD